MKAIRYVRAYLSIWCRWFDHKCARRAGQLAAKGLWRPTR